MRGEGAAGASCAFPRASKVGGAGLARKKSVGIGATSETLGFGGRAWSFKTTTWVVKSSFGVF